MQYAYSEMSSGANHSRLTSITYPSGYVLTFNYSSGLNSDISRLSSLSDTSGTLESYDYLGMGTVVRWAHSQPGADLTYIKQSGESNGDAGDQYTGLDRFSRVVDRGGRCLIGASCPTVNLVPGACGHITGGTVRVPVWETARQPHPPAPAASSRFLTQSRRTTCVRSALRSSRRHRGRLAHHVPPDDCA